MQIKKKAVPLLVMLALVIPARVAVSTGQEVEKQHKTETKPLHKVSQDAIVA